MLTGSPQSLYAVWDQGGCDSKHGGDKSGFDVQLCATSHVFEEVKLPVYRNRFSPRPAINTIRSRASSE